MARIKLNVETSQFPFGEVAFVTKKPRTLKILDLPTYNLVTNVCGLFAISMFNHKVGPYQL